MPKLVVNGAKLKCSRGTAPSTLAVLPVSTASGASQRAATVKDIVPTVNIAPFGMCQTQANPEVAAATAAAQGVLTPMPCVPVIAGPWQPGAATTEIDHAKVLSDDSTCSCAWTGSIEITDPGSEIDVA